MKLPTSLRAISSHLQTCGCSMVVGSNPDKVNKVLTGCQYSVLNTYIHAYMHTAANVCMYVCISISIHTHAHSSCIKMFYTQVCLHMLLCIYKKIAAYKI